jgi:hypothetical protein
MSCQVTPRCCVAEPDPQTHGTDRNTSETDILSFYDFSSAGLLPIEDDGDHHDAYHHCHNVKVIKTKEHHPSHWLPALGLIKRLQGLAENFRQCWLVGTHISVGSACTQIILHPRGYYSSFSLVFRLPMFLRSRRHFFSPRTILSAYHISSSIFCGIPQPRSTARLQSLQSKCTIVGEPWLHSPRIGGQDQAARLAVA